MYKIMQTKAVAMHFNTYSSFELNLQNNHILRNKWNILVTTFKV